MVWLKQYSLNENNFENMFAKALNIWHEYLQMMWRVKIDIASDIFSFRYNAMLQYFEINIGTQLQSTEAMLSNI